MVLLDSEEVGEARGRVPTNATKELSTDTLIENVRELPC